MPPSADTIENRLPRFISALTALHTATTGFLLLLAMSQPLSTYQKRFDALKEKSLAGDASATSELAQMCLAYDVGTLAKIMPIVQRHLHTLPPSEIDRWTELPEICNTLATMTLLAHVLEKEKPNSSVLNHLCTLCPFVEGWVFFLFRSMGIPDDFTASQFPEAYSVIVRDASLLLIQLFSVPHISRVLYTPNHLLLRIRDTWIWASDMGHHALSEVLGVLLASALTTEDLTDALVSELVVYQAMLARSIDVGRAAVQCLVRSLDLDLPTTKLICLQPTMDMVSRVRSRSDDARRSMIAHNVLRWLCLAARRFATHRTAAYPNEFDRVGRMIALIVQETTAFISLTHGGLRIALRHHFLESFLRLEPWLHDNSFFKSPDSDKRQLHFLFPIFISLLRSHLMIRSCLPLIRRSVREVEVMHIRDNFRRGGEIEKMYGEFLDALAVRGDWIDRYSSSQRCLCVNPTCPCKISSSASCPIIMKKCTRCSFATYCSRACQKEHWSAGSHQVHCGRLQSARAGGTSLLPVSPKDTEMIYALIRHEMADYPELFIPPDSETDSYHLRKEWPVENHDIAFRFDFNSSEGGVISQDANGFVSLKELGPFFEITSEAFMYQAHWEGCLARARTDGDPPVLITTSKFAVIEVTSFSRISKSLYPVEIFE